MASKLLNSITKRFHGGVKKYCAKHLGFKEPAFQHFLQGRPVKDFVVVIIRRLYGRKYNNNGYSDTQLLDLLEEDYDATTIKKYMDRYK